jgi:hypothetical protein
LSILSDLASRFGSLVFSKREDAELDEEMRFHIEKEIEKNLAAGMRPREARRQAHIKFGGVERMRERTREARGVGMLESLMSDIRYAARGLRKSLGFTLSAVLVLALGVGASVTALATVHGVLVEPLPYPEPESLVRVWVAMPGRGMDRADISYPNYLDWAGRARSLTSVGAYTSFLSAWTLIREGEAAEELATAWVAGDFFETMGAPALFGRGLTAEDTEVQRAAASRRPAGEGLEVGRAGMAAAPEGRVRLRC